MNKQLIRQLLKESINQNYISVYNIINEKLLELDDSTAAKIFIECCRVFYEKDKDLWVENNKKNMNCLFQVLFICNGRINEIDDILLLGYFQSMYFLVVHLHEKKKYEKLLEMNNLLMPNFMDQSKNEKVLKVYHSICNRIYNIICEFSNSEKNSILYHDFLTILLGMRFLHYPTKVALAESTYIFIKSKMFSDCGEHIQHNLFTFILELINKKKNEEDSAKHLEDVYCATLKILEVFIGVSLKQHKINKVQEIIDVANSMTSKSCHTIIYQKLFGLILSVTKLLIKLSIIEDCMDEVTKMFEICIEDFNDFCKHFGFLPNLQKTCKTISVLMYNWVEYFLTSKPSWTFLEQNQIQKLLFKFVSGVGKVVSKVPLTCLVCSSCEVQTDLNTSVQITSLIGNLWKLSVAQSQEISVSSCLIVLHYFENCCTHIKTLKDLNCQSWKSLWNQVGTNIYNVGVKLYARKNRDCLKFFILVIRTHNYLEGISTNSIFKFNIINSSLMCLTEIYLQFNEYKSALTFAALGIFIRTNTLQKVYRDWVRAKSAVRESNDDEILKYTELTVVECLQQNIEKIRTVYPDFSCDFENSDVIKLSIDELDSYKMLWQSKVPMKCAFLKLYEVADLITSIKALIKYWGFNAFLINEDIFLLLPKMLDKLEHESGLDKMEKQILLASLYVIQYYYETWKARNRMIDTINNTVVFEEPAPLPHEQPKNPNDEFDLVSSYINLKIDVHGKIWDILSKSLDIFQKCLSKTVLPSTIEILKEYDVYKIILNMVYEFKIHCNSLKIISACFLGLQISKLLENKIFTLEMASLLLEEKMLSSTMLKDVIAECNSMEKELCDSDDATAMLTQYCTSKSLMHLREENVKLGYQEYEIACKYCNKLPQENKYEAIKLKVQFLHVKYLQLPCSFKIEGHDLHSLEKFSNVYNNTVINYKENGRYSLFTTLLYMEVSQSVADFYKWMHLPREVRCFCRDIVTLVQSLVFPIRTAYFIIYLAQADLLSSRLSDCQIKLKELANILCLRNDKPMDFERQSPIKQTNNVDNLIESLRDINLNSHNSRQLTGSPELPIKDFQFPTFMKHSNNCDCFYCVNVEYKCLILMYVTLVAQLNLSQGNLKVANSYFQNGLRIYDYMVNAKQQNFFKIKTTKELSSYPFYNLQDLLCPTYSTMLLEYGNFLLKSSNFTKADIINNNLMNLMSKQKYNNMFLYNEARFQKMLIIMTEMNLQEISEVKIDAMDNNENLENVKTPENKRTKVVFEMRTPTVSSMAPKRRLRKIKCDLSFEDEDDKPATPKVSKRKIVSKKETKMNSAALCKTPAPISTHSYVATSIKRPVLQKISPINSTKSKIFTNLDIPTIVPMSPNAYTPNAMKAQTTIKNLSKNGKTAAALSEQAKVKLKQNSQDVKDGIRKNLMGELSEVDDSRNKSKSIKKPPITKRIKSKEQETKLPRPTRSCKRL